MELVIPVISMAVIAGICALAARVTRRRTWDTDQPGRAGRLAAGLAVLAAVVLAPWNWLFHGPSSSVHVWFGTGFAVILATGFTAKWWARPTGALRSASLTTSRAGVELLPALRMRTVVAVGTATIVLVMAGLLTHGSIWTRRWHEFSGDSRDDFPGGYVTWPLLLWLAGCCLAAAWSLRQVGAMPATSDRAKDAAVRLRSSARVLRGLLFGSAATAAYVGISVGKNVNEATQRLRVAAGDTVGAPRSPWDFVQWFGFACTGVGLLMVLLAISALPRPALPDVSEPSPGPLSDERSDAGAATAGPA